MISRKAQEIIQTLKKNYEPIMDFQNLQVEERRELFNQSIVLEPLPEGIHHETGTVNGVPVEKISLSGSTDKIIMHIHGGGMIIGDSSSSRFMLAHVADLTKRNAISVDYRLCPEYTQPAAVEDCVSVYCGLLEQGYDPKNIVLLGESAGGALVLSLCAYLKKNKMEMPAAVCSISGSVDSQYESASMTKNRETEIVVNANLKEMMNALYYTDTDPKDPVFSPIYSDLHGWPPVYLHACQGEILLDESIRMYLKLEEAGVETKLTIKEGLFHTYMMFDLPESYEAFEEIASFFNEYS